MAYANISYHLPAEHFAEIQSSITLIAGYLPFLVNLTERERQAVRKMAARDSEQTDDVVYALAHHPQIFPASFNPEEFHRDIALHDQIGQISLSLISLAEKVKFTEMALGGEIMKSTSQGYELIQAAGKSVPGIQGLAKKMRERYKTGKKKNANANV